MVTALIWVYWVTAILAAGKNGGPSWACLLASLALLHGLHSLKRDRSRSRTA